LNPRALANPHEKSGHFENSAGSGGANSGAPGAGNPADNPPDDAPDDPDLVAIVAAWPTLPGPVKAGIVAMVRAAGGTNSGGGAA
jgi:hypothetical protein